MTTKKVDVSVKVSQIWVCIRASDQGLGCSQEIRQTCDLHERIVNIPLHTWLPLSQSTEAVASEKLLERRVKNCSVKVVGVTLPSAGLH